MTFWGANKDERIREMKRDVTIHANEILGRSLDAFGSKSIGLKGLNFTLNAATSSLQEAVTDKVKDMAVSSIERQVARKITSAAASKVFGVVANLLDPLEAGRGSSTTERRQYTKENIQKSTTVSLLSFFMYGLTPENVSFPEHNPSEKRGFELRNGVDETANRELKKPKA